LVLRNPNYTYLFQITLDVFYIFLKESVILNVLVCEFQRPFQMTISLALLYVLTQCIEIDCESII